MTPNTPAGGAVAWSYEHNFGDDKWETRLTFSQPVESAWNRNIRPLAYADATVPPDAVLALVARLREPRTLSQFMGPHNMALALVEERQQTADELEALTREATK